jgi:thioredoxin reductase (NADPH)
VSGEASIYDLLVVGAGPTGIAIGAEARRAGLSCILLDRRGICGSLLGFPHDMVFFTTRDKLEIAEMPFAIPEDKPSRRQAISYYQGVARRHRLEVAAGEEVVAVAKREDGIFVVGSRRVAERPGAGAESRRLARAVALAQGFFDRPRRLGVPGEDLPWVASRYYGPWSHYEQHVLVVGAGNTAAETALDLWRHGARVTLVHRGRAIKSTVKYWLAPDLENRIAEGSIEAHFGTTLTSFEADGTVRLVKPEGERDLRVDAAYVLIGYDPEPEIARAAGVVFTEGELIPSFDPSTCESNVPGLYVAGTLQAGRFTNRLFIENTRDHGEKVVRHLQSELQKQLLV